MSPLSFHIDCFIHHIAGVRRLSAHTVSAYQRELNVLRQATDDMPIAHISALTLKRFIAADTKIKASSLARRLAAWRSFFDFLVRQELIADNPARQVKAPKMAKPLPKALTPDEMAAFLQPTSDDWRGIRDLAMMELLYSSGLRVSELTALDIDDIDLTTNQVHLRHTKGQRQRITPLGKKAVIALKRWLQQRSQLLSTPPLQMALFVNQRRSRLTTRTVELRLEFQAKRLGLAKSVSPHMLRHSCASHFLQSSGDLRATQELLGHQNIATTQIYTRLDFQHLAAVYDLAHPRDHTTITPNRKKD